MTARQMYPAIGTLVAVRFESLEVNCYVTDVKSAYGEVRLKVKPVVGAGDQWITMSRVNRIEEGK